jgi:hypothetical protein
MSEAHRTCGGKSGGTGGRPPGREQGWGRRAEPAEHAEASRGVRGVVPPGENKGGEDERSSSNMRRRRRESNPCTGLCRPLPKPLGHSAVGASFADGLRAVLRGSVSTLSRTTERTTGFEPATLTLAR